MTTSHTDLASSVARLKRLVPRLRGKRVGVVGDLMLDRYLWGTASRLSPEAAVPEASAEAATPAAAKALLKTMEGVNWQAVPEPKKPRPGRSR